LESGYIRAALTSEIAVGKIKKVTADDIQILIVNVDGKFYAVDSLCTHYGGDLSEGKLEGKILTCPIHGAKFHVDGKVVSPPTEPLDRPEIENLPTYPLIVKNQEIFIKIKT
jgi:nitrite reductase/ring-hydroxylating ferredoxin subunit